MSEAEKDHKLHQGKTASRSLGAQLGKAALVYESIGSGGGRAFDGHHFPLQAGITEGARALVGAPGRITQSRLEQRHG